MGAQFQFGIGEGDPFKFQALATSISAFQMVKKGSL